MKQGKIDLVFKALKLEAANNFYVDGQYTSEALKIINEAGFLPEFVTQLDNYSKSIGVNTKGKGWDETFKIIRTKQAETLQSVLDGGHYDPAILEPILDYELERFQNPMVHGVSISHKLDALRKERAKPQIDTHGKEIVKSEHIMELSGFPKPEGLAPDEAKAVELPKVGNPNPTELELVIAERDSLLSRNRNLEQTLALNEHTVKKLEQENKELKQKISKYESAAPVYSDDVTAQIKGLERKNSGHIVKIVELEESNEALNKQLAAYKDAEQVGMSTQNNAYNQLLEEHRKLFNCYVEALKLVPVDEQYKVRFHGGFNE